MATFNPDFWEIPATAEFLERVPADRALWYETQQDRDRRHATKDFYEAVKPEVLRFIEGSLTPRQREVVELYFFRDKTQEDIAAILNLSQSTVSRHLFGTVRDGKKVGGALPKLRKVIERAANPLIDNALAQLQDCFAEAV